MTGVVESPSGRRRRLEGRLKAAPGEHTAADAIHASAPPDTTPTNQVGRPPKHGRRAVPPRPSSSMSAFLATVTDGGRSSAYTIVDASHNNSRTRTRSASPARGAAHGSRSPSARLRSASPKCPWEKQNKVCVCEICTCGRHHCPTPGQCAHQTTVTPFEGTTMYRQAFSVHRAKERPLRRQPAEVPDFEPFRDGHFATSNGLSFKFHRVSSAPTQRHGSASPTRARVAFDATTTHRSDFTPKSGPPQPRHRPHALPDWVPPLDCRTSQREDYRPMDIKKSHEVTMQQYGSSMGAFDRSRRLPNLRFTATSTTRAEYLTPNTGPPPSRLRPGTAAASSSASGVYDTTYKTEYPARAVPQCPVLTLPPRAPADESGHILYTPHEEEGRVRTRPRPDFALRD